MNRISESVGYATLSPLSPLRERELSAVVPLCARKFTWSASGVGPGTVDSRLRTFRIHYIEITGDYIGLHRITRNYKIHYLRKALFIGPLH